MRYNIEDVSARRAGREDDEGAQRRGGGRADGGRTEDLAHPQLHPRASQRYRKPAGNVQKGKHLHHLLQGGRARQDCRLKLEKTRIQRAEPRRRNPGMGQQTHRKRMI